MNRPIAPLYATVNVTGICNLSCRYCYFQPRKYLAMNQQDYIRVIEELRDNRVFLLNISGGEPFTHPLICGFLRFAHETFDHVIVLSNGTILSSEHVATIKEIMSKKGIFPIQISLDSIVPSINRKTRCDPGIVINNIRILHKIKATFSIAMVVSKFNIGTVRKSIMFLSKYTKYFHLMAFQPVRVLNGKDQEYQVTDDELCKFFKSTRNLAEKLDVLIDTPLEEGSPTKAIAYGAPCQAAFSHIVVDPDLEVRPCDKLTEISLGNLSSSSLKSIWNSKAAIQIVKQPIPICIQ